MANHHQIQCARRSCADLPIAEVPEILTFWSDGSLDRPAIPDGHAGSALTPRIGWCAPDTGWTSNDFEVLPSTWIRLRFGTATEELEMGKRHFRCRLTSRWSLLARIFFGLLSAALALFIFLFARDVPWVWISLLLLPLLAWFFESESSFHKNLLVRLWTRPAAPARW
jgi:hypothetical protein